MKQVATGVHQLSIQRFVNAYFVAADVPSEEPNGWVLVDTGLPGSEKTIIAAADQLFGAGARPQAILLTHGHNDHAGSARALTEHWRVPVLAHPLELPFLTARATYPAPDPTVDGGGSLAFAVRFFPRDSPQLRDVVQALPTASDEVPYLPGWRWLHVPGHAPGQVALFRESDRTLLGGDAFATTHHASIPVILLQVPRISVAGAPFNYNWEQVRESVQKLAALRPENIGCGHGPVIQGPAATEGLQRLADHFPMPAHGRYVHTPARTDETGVAFVPPAPTDSLPRTLTVAAAGAGAAIGGLLLVKKLKNRQQNRYPRRYPEEPKNPRTGKTPQ